APLGPAVASCRSNGAGAGPGAPVQPTHVACSRPASSGYSALTRPPGLRRHTRPSAAWTVSSAPLPGPPVAGPFAPVTSSTGSRFATTMNGPFAVVPSPGASSLWGSPPPSRVTGPPFGRYPLTVRLSVAWPKVVVLVVLPCRFG